MILFIKCGELNQNFIISNRKIILDKQPNFGTFDFSFEWGRHLFSCLLLFVVAFMTILKQRIANETEAKQAYLRSHINKIRTSHKSNDA